MAADIDPRPAIKALAYQSNQPPSPPTPVCPKCESRMVQGLTFASKTGRGVAGRTLWVAGQICRGWLGGVLWPKGQWYEVITFRCPGCGFLESYGPPG